MAVKQKKICIVTGTRAEYGLMKRLIQKVKNSDELELQLIVTGMHLSPEFGNTISEINEDGHKIDKKIEMLLSSDSPVGISKSIGLGIIGFADALEELRPDILVLLGDRYEIHSAATAAMVARIPIAHIHGGETTEGLIDEAIRHSITKMSHIHFVSTQKYRDRVIQLGENPSNVFCVGGLGVDAIMNIDLMNINEIDESNNFQFLSKNILVTFHPVTLEQETSRGQIDELLKSLSNLDDTGIIFTMPNADTDGRILIEKINNFCQKNKFAKAYQSLGQLKYLSCLQNVDLAIGNSSSGLLEVPSFKKATINIGDRQKGRIKATSVIDCEPKEREITESIKKVYSKEFQEIVQNTVNPYGTGGASESVVEVLTKLSLDNLLKKKFFDLEK